MPGKCNLFVINTQCQIKNKQLLCFSCYLQHRFNYFDPIRAGNEELGASDVDKLWQFCIVSLEVPLLQPPLFKLLVITVMPLTGNAAR